MGRFGQRLYKLDEKISSTNIHTSAFISDLFGHKPEGYLRDVFIV
jgi:hypothetical protein